MRSTMLRPLLAALLLALVAVTKGSPAPEVTLTAGALKGTWTATKSGRPIAAFEGVPFAKPPVGNLRFQPPVPAEPWSGVRVADRPGAMCLQRNVFIGAEQLEGSEDCLFLNVYAPETVSRPKPLPVMVYIHGGGFICGASHLYGPEFLLDRDVVLVTINYRLGPLGFLSTGDDVIPGNFGMKDMVLALRWVRDNVRAFGGDPNKVTIFGESAGGAAVHMLTLSPLSQGLFHRAIAMSGSALAPGAFQDKDESLQRAQTTARALGCPAEPSDKFRECLMAKPAEEITSVDRALMEWLVHPMVPFKIVAEPSGPGAFLDRHPSKVYGSGRASDVPFMTGFVSHEGCIGVVPLLENPTAVAEFDQRFDELAPIVFLSSNLPKDVQKDVFRKVRKFYFGDKAISNETRWEFINLFSDHFFIHSVLETARLQKKAAKNPVFVYELAHTSDRSWSTVFGAKSASYGVCHADDLLHLFPLTPLFPQARSDSDKSFSEYLVDLFTTFAATGRPTKDGSWQEVQEPERAEYLRLNEADDAAMQKDFSPERIKLWYKLPVDVALAAPASSLRDEL